MAFKSDQDMLLDRICPDRWRRFEDRKEWLADRRLSIGASETPAILGIDRFGSPWSVWADKVRPQLKTPTLRMRLGLAFEQVAREVYEEATGRKVLDVGLVKIQHADSELVTSSPDGFVTDAGGGEIEVLQIKAIEHRGAADWVYEPPNYVQAQVQHEMAVCGLRRAAVIAIVGKDAHIIHSVERNERFCRTLVQKLERFYRDHVVANVPPETDGHEGTRDALHRYYDELEPGAILDLPDGVQSLEASRDHWMAQRKQSEHEIRRIDNEVKSVMGHFEFGRFAGGGHVSWKQNKAGARTLRRSPKGV